MIAGILLYEWAGAQLGVPLLLWGAAAVSLVFLCAAVLRNESRLLRAVRIPLLQAMIVALSLLCAALSDDRRSGNWYGHSLESSAAHQLRVTGEPQQRERTWKLPVAFVAAIDSSGGAKTVCGRATLYLYRNGDTVPPFRQGDLIVAGAHWQPVRNDGNPHGFDLERFSRHNNLFHSQVCGREEVLLYRPAVLSEQSWLERGHRWCVGRLQAFLPDRKTFGLLQAMLMGDERDFDEELRQAYAETGVVHIVSISGSHTATLFLIVTLLFFWLKSKRWVWVKFALGVLLVWVYVLMAGAPPSALRSAVMFSVFAFGAIIGRQGHPMNTLLSAAFILLCANPGWLFSAGFQLSFLAVLSLVLFYQPVYRCWPQTTWLGRQVWALLAGSLAAELLTAPLVVYYFHSFPLLFIVANILAMLLVGLVALGGGLLILAFSWLPPLARCSGWCVMKAVGLFNTAILWLQRHTPASMQHLRLNVPELALCYAVIAAFAFAFIRKMKWAATAGGMAACCLMALLLRDSMQSRRQSRLLVYNANRRFLAEVHEGTCYRIASRDSAEATVKAAESARNASGAWREGLPLGGPCFEFHRRSILVLDSPIGPGDSAGFPVDVLIAGYPLRPEQLPGLRACFQPKQLVVAGYQKRWVKEALEDSAKRWNGRLYLTWVRGAYVLE